MHTGLDPNWQGTERSVCVFVITKHLCIYTYVDDCLAVKTFSPGFSKLFLEGSKSRYVNLRGSHCNHTTQLCGWNQPRQPQIRV